jgi:Heavy metal associated domain 2
MAALLPINTLRRHAVQPAFLAHDIVGRLRIVVPHVQDDARAAAALCAVLRGIDGVTEARANTTTGSVIVRYDPHSTARGGCCTHSAIRSRGSFGPGRSRMCLPMHWRSILPTPHSMRCSLRWFRARCAKQRST